jgi:large subunit ribosomal protein L21
MLFNNYSPGNQSPLALQRQAMALPIIFDWKSQLLDGWDRTEKKMFAVLKTGGKQYRVAAEDILSVERLAGEVGETIVFDQILMMGEGDSVTVGTPVVAGASVSAEITAQGRAAKVIAFKKRRRQNSRRKRGHRQLLTTVKIMDISADGKKPAAKKKAAKPAAAPESDAKAEAPTAKTAAPAEAVALFTAPEGAADDLKKISGVGPVLEKKLNALGITQYAQVASFSKDDIERVDAELNFKGRIEREDWIAQATTLAKGSE